MMITASRAPVATSLELTVASLLFAGSVLFTVHWKRQASKSDGSSVVAAAISTAPSYDDDLILQDTSSRDVKDDSTAPENNNQEPKQSNNRNKKSLRLVKYLSDHASKSGGDSSDWDTYTDDAELFVQEFPKIELHIHLDGTFDPDVLYSYMQENPTSLYSLPTQTDLPWEPGRKLAVRSMVQQCETARDYHKLCTCRGYRSLKEMLNCFEVFLPLVRGNLELLEKLAYDFCQRQWEQHAIYTEVRYSPFLLAEGFQENDADDSGLTNGIKSPSSSKYKNKVDAEMVFAAVTKGLRRGSKQFGITVNQILCAITWRPDWAMPTLAMVQQHQTDFPCATVGIDVAAGEEHFDQTNFPVQHAAHYEMIQQAKALGIPITLHAGEATDQARENVRRAISEYGASRIGHGYRMTQSDELMQFVRESKCHVEVCPTSSVETGGWIYDNSKAKDWKSHPCLDMLRCGVPVSFNSDDPAVFHTSLAWQYRVALAKMGLSREELIQSNLDAIDAAFCSPEQKEELRETVLRHVRTGGSSSSTRRSFRRSITETFFDRVYLSAKEYV